MKTVKASAQKRREILITTRIVLPTISSNGKAVRQQAQDSPGRDHKPEFADRIRTRARSSDINAAKIVAANRVQPLRQYDQIPMREDCLAKTARLMIPELAGQSVVFVGDNDGACLMAGMITASSSSAPAKMTLLDFDERILDSARALADKHGFSDILECVKYNAFDELPSHVVGKHSWFYVNPPYGSNNHGESARLFAQRGMEACRANNPSGCLILPYDRSRLWTTSAMGQTQSFLSTNGWVIRNSIASFHGYYLDDDKDLRSSLIIIETTNNNLQGLSYAGRRVAADEIPSFYGKTVFPPFARYINSDGSEDFNWN